MAKKVVNVADLNALEQGTRKLAELLLEAAKEKLPAATGEAVINGRFYKLEDDQHRHPDDPCYLLTVSSRGLELQVGEGIDPVRSVTPLVPVESRKDPVFWLTVGGVIGVLLAQDFNKNVVPALPLGEDAEITVEEVPPGWSDRFHALVIRD